MVIFFINCFILYRFILQSAKLRQFFQNHLWMPLKVGLNVLSITIVCVFGIDIGQHFQNILSGDKDFTNKTILNTNTLSFEWVFLLIHICRCLYFITFVLKNRHFCPPKCPRDKKGTKNTSLECLGHKRGTKLIFYDSVNYIKIRVYLIDYQ